MSDILYFVDIISHAPLEFKKSELVVIKIGEKSHAREKEYPWIGKIYKVKQKEVTVQWYLYVDNKWHLTNTARGRQSVQRCDVMAKIKVDGIEKLSTEVLNEIWKMSGF